MPTNARARHVHENQSTKKSKHRVSDADDRSFVKNEKAIIAVIKQQQYCIIITRAQINKSSYSALGTRSRETSSRIDETIIDASTVVAGASKLI